VRFEWNPAKAAGDATRRRCEGPSWTPSEAEGITAFDQALTPSPL